jgi:hypothetical protein
MDNVEDKIKNLDTRISDVSKQIDELLQTKINLMMLKREIQFDDVRERLQNSYDKTQTTD